MTLKSKTLYIFSSLLLMVIGCTDDFMKSDNISGNQIVFSGTVEGPLKSLTTRSGETVSPAYFDGSIQIEGKNLGTLYLHSFVNEDYATVKGMQTRTDNESGKTVPGDVYVSAYASDNKDDFSYENGDDASMSPNFMIKELVTKGESVYVPKHNRYWPNSDNYIRFFAFSSEGKSDVDDHSVLHYNHSVSADLAEHNKVMVAATGPLSSSAYRESGTPVPLQFHHILTSVRVAFADKDENILRDYTIKSIGFKNLATSGTFYMRDFESNTGEGYFENREDYQNAMWVISSEKQDISFTVSKASKTSDGDQEGNEGNEGINDNPSDAVDYAGVEMLMIPQNLTDVKLELVIVSENGEETPLELDLSGRKWIMGDKVTYELSSTEDTGDIIFQLLWKDGDDYVIDNDEKTHIWRKGALGSGYAYDCTWHAPFYDINYYDNSEVNMSENFRVVSYKRTINDNGEIETTPLAWKMSQLTYEESNEDWMKDKGAEEGSDLNTNFSFTVKNQPLRKTDPREDLYKGKTPADFLPAGALDSDGYWDLSKKYTDAEGNVVMNTANCYIINAPGNYKFPAIYGNAISHGKINDYAYKDSREGDEILNIFYGADASREVLINSPVIAGVTNPGLVWTDSREFKITMGDSEYVTQTFQHINGSGSEELHYPYVKFTIDKEGFSQGNFCIGYNNATAGTRWSWHLWVTPYSSDESKIQDQGLSEDRQMQRAVNVTDLRGDTYEVFPYNVGWCDRLNVHFGNGYDGKLTPRTYTCEYVQAETGKKIKLTVSQRQEDDVQYGNNLLFQWGRRSPLRGSYIFQTAEPIVKNFYELKNGKYDYYPINWPTGQKSISYVLGWPANVFLGDGVTDWCTKRYDNLWSIQRTVVIGKDKDDNDITDTRYYKTVYDPSPVGYMVPPANVFDNMSNSAEWIDNPIWGMRVSVDGKYLYFPVTGYRDLTANLQQAGLRAYYLTSSIVTYDGYGYVDGINVGRILGKDGNYTYDIDPSAVFSRIISGAVRPIREPGYDYLNVDSFVQDPDIIVDMN